MNVMMENQMLKNKIEAYKQVLINHGFDNQNDVIYQNNKDSPFSQKKLSENKIISPN